jgi:hypothetical protein
MFRKIVFLTLKMKTLRFFENQGTIYPTKVRSTAEVLTFSKTAARNSNLRRFRNTERKKTGVTVTCSNMQTDMSQSDL